MIPNDHRATVLFTAADMKPIRSVVCMVVTLSELRTLLPEAAFLELAAMTEQKSGILPGECISLEIELSFSITNTRYSKDPRMVRKS